MTLLIYILVAVTASLLTLVYYSTVSRSKKAELTHRLTQAEHDRALAEHAREFAEQQVSETRMELRNERDEKERMGRELASLQSTLNYSNEKLQLQKQELESLHERFSKEFENLANRILEEKTGKFTEQNRVNLDLILNPLKEKIKAFEDKVEQTYKAEAAERNSLKGEIRNLVDLNKKISDEANQLAIALKGDNKQQGDWGEIVLERLLEHSGLEKGREYELQYVTNNSNGDKIKPDAVIFLPDKKHLIIDAKVSLKSYHDFISANEDQNRESALKMHIASVKNHIKLLSEKYYQTARELNSPDFILMFIPTESSFSSALKADEEIFSYAWDRKIVVVSPTTLLATLRTIASIWKQERQTRNALLIAEEGGKMYDKLVGFMEDLIKVGRKINDSKDEYTSAMNKLFEGSGNLIKRAEKMKELGAKVSKSISQQLIERAE
ncbi:MAG: DNA recombination protein RmuC [Bacteroidia bacterium]|nr:DNA recombination protein RmuC [Bacteroidia bacterium]MCZ2276626.1 DNA recombination protein RmuC [Bacteroidia bacterium]